MLLHDLLRRFDPSLSIDALPNVEIHGAAEDSRLVKPGDLFIARAGTKADGAQFIADAAARGAAAALGARAVPGLTLPQVVCDDPAAASKLANIICGDPSAKVKVLGITGTNGKTTVTYLIRHILSQLGMSCGMIGTVEIDDGKARREATMTTPGAVEIPRLLAMMHSAGCRACAIETSSHALDQHRTAGVRYAAAAFTNLTGDHLDYHKTMESYAAAKARLFEQLSSGVPACVNGDDPWSKRMIERCPGRVVRWGFGQGADYRATDIAVTAKGSHFMLATPDGTTEVHMQLIGRHNIANALCAAAVLGETFGLSSQKIAAALATAGGAPGRLQAICAGQPFAVLVDYAHTDDAMENVLTALRPLTRGKLRVVFGCGGERDPTKRPRMAGVAQRLADVVYVTSDNPRTENPQAIIDEIMSGFTADSAKTIRVEPDRRRAIELALSDARSDDVVLLAGKGHENYQIIGTTKHHFDDVEEALRVLRTGVEMSAA